MGRACSTYGQSRNAYRVLVGRPEGKRPLGRPRRWEDNIKMDLREVGYDDRDWLNLAQDRDRWRAYVRAAMNLRRVKFLFFNLPEHITNSNHSYSNIDNDMEILHIQPKKPETRQNLNNMKFINKKKNPHRILNSQLNFETRILFDTIMNIPHHNRKPEDSRIFSRLWTMKNNTSKLVDRSLPPKETLRGHSDSSFRGESYIQCCVDVRLCDMYSNQELAEIHFMYGKADDNAALARCLYQERYPQRQCPDRKTFVRLHYRLCEYGKFNSPGLGRGRPRSTTPEVQEEILEAVNMTPSISTRRVALQVNVPHTSVWRLLKEYQLYPYHLQRVQALSPADYPARVRLSVVLAATYGTGVHKLPGKHNRLPHVLEDTPLINRQHIHFLHDGAPAHFSRTARRYLDRRFPDRWIGRGGPIAWPPRSPDLNPLDFYLWGHLKSLVYSSPVPDLESLRNRIVACSEDIRNTPGVWDRVRRSMRHRCEVCIQAGGGHFEHLL
ncbi:hypothetical protein ANN_08225 [Periplaneta americana]|uniref:DUF4817 domain-containing protein n=1 Tax=Periplaneta americana TaxID=6978 RepID=A0ABQ8T2D1_PERAM|nr:hypothetical protein ANN_08225 [Periplaneta americana]